MIIFFIKKKFVIILCNILSFLFFEEEWEQNFGFSKICYLSYGFTKPATKGG